MRIHYLVFGHCLNFVEPSRSAPRPRVGGVLLLACLSLLGRQGAFGAQYGDFTYTTSGINATITGYTGAGGAVALPLNISGYRVAYIGGYAFYGVTNMTSIGIPSSVISVQPSAFFGCNALVAINVDAANANLSSTDGVMFSRSGPVLLQCPAGRAGNYTVPNGVIQIASDAFFNCGQLTQVIIPASVTSIGNQAFDYCTGIKAYYFLGNAPSVYVSGFASSSATVFYMPGTTGWGSTFAGQPTVLWNPQLQTGDPSFGMHTNGFGFTITGSSNLVIVVEACNSLVESSWFPVGTNTLTDGTSYFNDPDWTNSPSRYYRLRSP